MTTCYEEPVLSPYDVRTVFLKEILAIELLRYTVKHVAFIPIRKNENAKFIREWLTYKNHSSPNVERDNS